MPFPLIAPAGMALLKLVGGTAAAGGLAAGAYGLSQIPESIKEGILSSGPNDPSDPTKFKTNPLQNLLIDEENLKGEYFKRQQKDLYDNNSAVRDRINQLGITEKDIGTRSAAAFLADTKKESERLTTNENLKKIIEAMPGGGAKLASMGDAPTTAKLREAQNSLDEQDKYGGGRGTLIAADSRRIKAEAKEQSRYLDLLESQLADRRFQQMQAQNNFQLQMDQMGLNNRRLDMQDARAERKDKREMLGLLLQGLSNVQSNLVNY